MFKGTLDNTVQMTLSPLKFRQIAFIS